MFRRSGRDLVRTLIFLVLQPPRIPLSIIGYVDSPSTPGRSDDSLTSYLISLDGSQGWAQCAFDK